MRLLDILHKSAERWRLGLGFIQRKLGYGSKSRRLAESQATINQLRHKLHLADQELCDVKAERDLLEVRTAGITKEAAQAELELKLKFATQSIAEIKGKLDVALDEYYKKPVLTISEKDKLIISLREEVASLTAKYTSVSKELDKVKNDHTKQKHATAMMWKFIHLRHRIALPAAQDSIRNILVKAEGKR